MSSLKQDFDDLIARIEQGRDFQHASFEPVYYLVFSPKQVIEVVSAAKAVLVSCHSKDKGGVARKTCEAACIACGKCTELMRLDGVTGCVVQDAKVYRSIYKIFGIIDATHR